MIHSRVRTDVFTATGNTLQIRGRQGYEQSTDIWIDQTVHVDYEQSVVSTNDIGWHLLRGSQHAYQSPVTYTQANLNGEVELKLAPGTICNSMDNLKIKPTGCKSFYDAYPKIQRKILPYLCPNDALARVNFLEKLTHTLTFDESSETTNVPIGGMPEKVVWDPRILGNFVLGLHEDALEQGDVNGVEAVGFLPNDHIEIGVCTDPTDAASFIPFNDPHVFPIKYHNNEDDLTFNEDQIICIKLIAEALGGAQNPLHHVFALDAATNNVFYDNDSWSMKFDFNGIAGRVAEHGIVPLADVEIIAPPGNNPGAGHATYVGWVGHTVAYDNYLDEAEAAATRIDEINEAERWFGLKNRADYPEDQITYEWDDNNMEEFYTIALWTQAQPNRLVGNSLPIPQAFANGNSRIALYCRIPRYSKGQMFNWRSNPATNRFFLWNDKEVNDDNPELQHQITHTTTPWFMFQHVGTDIVNVKKGSFVVNWEEHGALVNGNFPNRRISSLVVTLDDPDLYAVIYGGQPTQQHTLKLQSARNVQKPFQAIVAAPPAPPGLRPTRDVVTLDSNTFFYLVFQTQQAAFAGGASQIVFARNAISANNTFPNGVPFVVSEDQLRPLWLDADEAGTPLIPAPTNLGANPFGVAGSPNADVWASPRPLFQTTANHLEDFTLHTQLLPADGVIAGAVLDDALFQALNNMFSGRVFVEEPLMPDYRTVLSGRSRSSIKLHEPLFGFDSGMSTHNPSHIFRPRSWYNILMQDFEYHFQGSDKTQQLLSRDAGVLQTLVNDDPQGPTLVLSPPLRFIKFRVPSETSVTVRSRNGLDQREKLIEVVHQSYPLLKTYSMHADPVVSPGNPECRIPIFVERAVPDYFFVFAERNFSSLNDFIPAGHPIVVGFEVYGRTNRNLPLCSYLSTKHEIWQATLRNSHNLADADELFEIGGILISKEDLGSLERDEFSRRDCFDYDVRVILENEMGGTSAQKTNRETNNSIKVTVCTIYNDQMILKGGARNLRFYEASTY